MKTTEMTTEGMKAAIAGTYRIEKDSAGWRVLHLEGGVAEGFPVFATYVGALRAATLRAPRAGNSETCEKCGGTGKDPDAAEVLEQMTGVTCPSAVGRAGGQWPKDSEGVR